MGDAGSLAIGGCIATISVLLKQEALFLILGGLFVVEAVSSQIQDKIGIKWLGRRLFYRAPFHHQMQHTGLAETKVVIRLWIVSGILDGRASARSCPSRCGRCRSACRCSALKPTETSLVRNAWANDSSSTYWFQSTHLDWRTVVPFTVSLIVKYGSLQRRVVGRVGDEAVHVVARCCRRRVAACRAWSAVGPKLLSQPIQPWCAGVDVVVDVGDRAQLVQGVADALDVARRWPCIVSHIAVPPALAARCW